MQADIIDACRKDAEKRDVARAVFSRLGLGESYPVTAAPEEIRRRGHDSRRSVRVPEYGKQVFVQESLTGEGKENLVDFLAKVRDADRSSPGVFDVTEDEFLEGEAGTKDRLPFALRVFDLLMPRVRPDAAIAYL